MIEVIAEGPATTTASRAIARSLGKPAVPLASVPSSSSQSEFVADAATPKDAAPAKNRRTPAADSNPPGATLTFNDAEGNSAKSTASWPSTWSVRITFSLAKSRLGAPSVVEYVSPDASRWIISVHLRGSFESER